MTSHYLEEKPLTDLSAQELINEYRSTGLLERGRRQEIIKYVLKGELSFRREFFDNFVKDI